MRVRKALPWLGWALAGVLALGVGGNALASGLGGGYDVAAGSDPAIGVADTGPTTAAADSKQDQRGKQRRGFARLGSRLPIHGEVTVRTDGGFEQVAFARGEVTAVSPTSLSIRSEDGVVTTFALNGDTRYRSHREQAAIGDLKVGVKALAAGPKSSAGTITARHVLIRAERPPAAKP